MTVVGICMVKDEADIIGYTVDHMLAECDAVIVADNMSTDATADILADIARGNSDLFISADPEPGYYQSRKMTALAARAAAALAATWVVPFDADEWWTTTWGPLREVLPKLPDGEGVAWFNVYDHVTTGKDDPAEPNPYRRMGWRRQASLEFPKVACRPIAAVTIEQGNHGAHYPRRTPNAVGTVHHFPYRSDTQFVSKVRNGAAAYAATDLPTEEGAHWRQYGMILDGHGEGALVEVRRQWFHVEHLPADGTMVYDPVVL